MEFLATCPKGLERLLVGELGSLGIGHLRQNRGQVSFEGTLADAYRACLWSRLASRVICTIARVGARDADELYQGLSAIPWEDHLPMGATFAIDASGVSDTLKNTQFTTLRTRDALNDRLLARRGARPVSDPASPDVGVTVHIARDRATVGIDLSGEPLFRRGYDAARTDRSPIAPLRADYASALLEGIYWFRDLRHDDPTLAVLWSGAGTLACEAAGQALDRAPGLARARWGMTGWGGHDAATWQALLSEADERAATGAQNPVTLVVADDRRGAEASARQMLRAAGMPQVADRLSFVPLTQAVELAGPQAPVVADLTWLPADDLAQEAAALPVLATAAGRRLALITPDPAVDAALGQESAGAIPIAYGNSPATLRAYDEASMDAAPAARPTVTVRGEALPVLVPASDQFAARLAKAAKLRAKWARREDVTCYRVYDADLPDYAVSIELYEGTPETPGRWVSISEYAAPKGVDLDLAHRRLLDVLAITPRVLDVAPANVSLRVRTKSRGGSQYAAEAEGGAGPHFSDQRRWEHRQKGAISLKLPRGAHLVDEGGLTFEVNFSSRLDCGIFLDHRDTRAMLREMMKDTRGSKRFLNLFAYTGTATVYAADGGAKFTTTVDMSRPSLDWARRNMERNGFAGENHEYVRADVLSWVGEQRHSANRWDLIFCDVPTFSNSKSMGERSWDVQRDHAELLINVSRLLTRNGIAVFSCNLRTFKPDVEKLARAGVELEDITAQTIPEDFARNPKIHHCYLVRHVAV